jgi:release factor glutamine methyltransferase
MLRADTPTLTEWLRDAERSLARAGIPSPRNDAERLAAFALGLRWGELWTRLREPIDEISRSRLEDVLEQRCGGEPLAYIVGSVVFCGVDIACGPGVLVPRPETETLVDVALELIADRREPIVVDIGTGTGAIGIAVARARPHARVWGTDVSPVALSYAARNVEKTGVSVQLLDGDLFHALPADLMGAIDLVVSNPPYIPDDAVLPPDVVAEPAEALRGGPRGDEALVRLVDGVAPWLSSHGAVALEVGTHEQAAALASMLDGFAKAGMRHDRNERPRVVWAKR